MVKKQTKLVKRRRQESRTDYSRRLSLLKGNSLRLVVRKSNKYIVAQVVESKHARDKVLISVSTRDLLEEGWPAEKVGGLKSLSAGYLCGYLLGVKAKDKVKGRVILDSGLIPSTKGSRVYAVVKGFKDSGIDIPVNEDILPLGEKIEKGEFFGKVKENIGSGK